MSDQEDDLSDIEAELAGKKGRPFIERPDALDVGPGTLCWLDGTRICGPDCVSFNSEQGLDDNKQPIDTPNKCIVLLYMGQQGSAAVATIALRRKQMRKIEIEEKTATIPTPPLPSAGGKT